MLVDAAANMYFVGMYAAIDSTTCIGCGLCEENLPAFFKIGDYTAELKTEEIPEKFRKELEETAEDCPSGAISIYGTSGEA